MYQYQVVVKTMDHELIKEIKFSNNNFNSEWSNLIEATEPRMDCMLTLEKRFVLTGDDAKEFISDWMPERINYTIFTDKLIMSHWDVIAEVNTSYKN